MYLKPRNIRDNEILKLQVKKSAFGNDDNCGRELNQRIADGRVLVELQVSENWKSGNDIEKLYFQAICDAYELEKDLPENQDDYLNVSPSPRLTINTETVNADPNFISGETLTISYEMDPMSPPEAFTSGSVRFEIRAVRNGANQSPHAPNDATYTGHNIVTENPLANTIDYSNPGSLSFGQRLVLPIELMLLE